MKVEETSLRFFLGANTPQGFVSRFDQLGDVDQGWRNYIIKGGPGCGKSTLMKKIAEEIQNDSPNMELIHCSSDVDSVDAVIAPELRISIADATLPHAIEPRYPGVFESLVDMTACWDEEELQLCREEILTLSRSRARCHEQCCRFLAAAGSLGGDTYRIALECVNTSKLSGYCERLAERELKPLKKEPGKERIRLLTAVTNQGVVQFTDSAKRLCERIYLVNDEHGAISRILLQTMRSKALAAGYDVISCYCPLGPFDKLEQLFIPELKIGFLTSNRFHDFSLEVDPYRIVNAQRFTDTAKLRENKKRLSFNRKAMSQMIVQAQVLLADAHQLHNELERYYIAATDYAKVDALTEQVLGKIQACQ